MRISHASALFGGPCEGLAGPMGADGGLWRKGLESHFVDRISGVAEGLAEGPPEHPAEAQKHKPAGCNSGSRHPRKGGRYGLSRPLWEFRVEGLGFRVKVSG